MATDYDLLLFMNGSGIMSRSDMLTGENKDIPAGIVTSHVPSYYKAKDWLFLYSSTGGPVLFDVSQSEWKVVNKTFPYLYTMSASAISKDGTRYIYAPLNYGAGPVCLMDLESWTTLATISLPTNVHSFGLLNSRNIVTTVTNGAIGGSCVQFRSQADLSMLAGFPLVPGNGGYRLDVSADERYVAYAMGSGMFVVDMEEKRLVTIPDAVKTTCFGVAFSPDGRFLAATQNSGTGACWVYDTTTWARVAILPPKGSKTHAVRFTHDSARLYVGCNAEPYYQRFDVSGWQEMSAPRTLLTGECTHLLFIEPEFTRIRGTVRDIDGNPAQRSIRAYRRASGVMTASTLSDPVTGDYSLSVIGQDHYDVQALAADGENLNDLFYARVTPG